MSLVNSLRGAVMFGGAPLSVLAGLLRRLVLGDFTTLVLSAAALLIPTGEPGGRIDRPLRVMIPFSVGRLCATVVGNTC